MLKTIIKKFIPNIILKYREKYIIKKNRSYFSKMKDYEIFKEIYLKKLWDPALENLITNFILVQALIFPN